MTTTLRRAASVALTFAVLTALLVVESGLAPPVGAAGSPVTGSFFVDYDRDGTIDAGESVSPGDAILPGDGISVIASDVAGGSTVCTTTDVSYSCDVSPLVGTSFRLDFSLSTTDLSAGYTETFRGPDSPSAVQFVDAGDTADFGIVPPSSCPTGGTGFDGNANSVEGKLWTTCLINGDRTAPGANDVLVGLNYDRTGSIEHIGYKNGGTSADNTTDGAEDELGALWGVA